MLTAGAGREPRVPLSRRALKTVKALHDLRKGDFVFPGEKPDKPLSVMALAMVPRRMKVDGVTGARLPLHPPRLGGGVHEFHQRGLRSRARACDREQG